MNKSKYRLNSNYILASFITTLNIGMIRKLRFVKVARSHIGLRLLRLFYQVGIIRTYRVKGDYISVYFKYYFGRSAFRTISIVSTPGNRCYVTLNELSKHYNYRNFSGFYVLTTPMGLVTSDYCLLTGKVSGEVLLKIEI